MEIRIIGVALVGTALILTGCSDKKASAPPSTSAAAPTSTAAPAPKGTDEDQIRDVLTQESAAFGSWNFARVGELTCPQFRAQAASSDGAVPPMSTFPAQTAASMDRRGSLTSSALSSPAPPGNHCWRWRTR